MMYENYTSVTHNLKIPKRPWNIESQIFNHQLRDYLLLIDLAFCRILIFKLSFDFLIN